MQNEERKTTVKNSKLDLKRRAYVYALDIIKFINTLPNNKTVDVLTKQLLRSATSIGANIIEAQAGRTRKDFANFFTHALKSANESVFWLCLLKDSHNANLDSTEKLIKETQELANILGASILTLKGRR